MLTLVGGMLPGVAVYLGQQYMLQVPGCLKLSGRDLSHGSAGEKQVKCVSRLWSLLACFLFFSFYILKMFQPVEK